MEEFILLLRIALAFVFALAGAAKLLDAKNSVKAVSDFGVPERLARPLGYLLPIAEIGLASSLLFQQSAWFAAIGSAILLAVFTAAMLWQMWLGKAPECHCFGQVRNEPVGAKSVVRNGLLLAIAVILSLTGKSVGTPLWATRGDLLQVVLLFVIAVATVLAVSYVRRILDSQAEIARRIDLLELLSSAERPKERHEAGDPSDGLPIGAVFPDFELVKRGGELLTLQQLLQDGHSVLFFFVGPNCSPCAALVPEIAGWNTELRAKANVVVVTSGTASENADKLKIDEGLTLLFDEGRALAQSVGAKWTPSAILVRPDGRVGSRIAAGDAAIRQLVKNIAETELTDKFSFISNGNGKRKPRIGERIPEFSLETVQGKSLSSRDLIGRPTLAVFWSRTCPHCVAMMSELKKWDSTKGQDETNLIVFSEGDASAHADLGLRSPVVLEEDYKTALGLGMEGTPSAVLIDKDGYIVSETAIGAANIWSLIGRR